MLVTKEKATITGDLTFAKKVEMGFDPAARNMQVRNAIRMYANPRLAALREYTSNARDAHQAAGHTGPVEVTLPTALHPFLTVVDKGVGLDAKELEGFGQFGHTTKDGSNDYIGGFGLGSKSGLAVADQFTVISVKDGKKNVVVVGWDESGAPSLGFLDEQDTDEHNGTTIQIPSATGHEDWANIIKGNTFLGWTPGSIIVNGQEPAKSVHNTDQFRKVDGGWLTTQERTGGRYHWPEWVHALVHGVYYAIPYHKFGDRTVAKILDGSVLEIENGSVDILPSRDDLEWTDRTTREVRRVADVLTKSIVAEYEKQIITAKTFRDARKIVDAMDEIGLPITGLTYKGVLLDWTKVLPEKKITVGMVKDSSTSATGFQNDRAASTTRVLGDVHQHPSILVVGATGETHNAHYRKDMRFVDESRDSVPYILSEFSGDERRKARIYFTNEAKRDLPEGFVLAMSKVITAKKFVEVATAKRKELAKENAANRAAGGRTKSVDRQLRVVSGYSTWAYTFGVVERSEQAIIAEGRPVVVLHYGDPVAARVLSAHSGSGASGVTVSLMQLIASHSQIQTATFVLLAKNHKASNLAIQGWVNLTDWLRETLKAVPVKTPLQIAVENYRRNRPHYNSVPVLTPANVANIKNKDMREWMQEYSILPPKQTTAAKAVQDVALGFPELAPKQPEPLDYKPWDHYPLLLNVALPDKEQHRLVDYINLVDSAR